MEVTPPILLLTRPRLQSERFWAELPEALRTRLVPLFAPLLEIVHLPATEEIEAEGFIFTSENGVAAAQAAGLVGVGRKAWCVGPRTADVAREAGLDAVDCGGTAALLLDRLDCERPTGRLVHVRGRHAAVAVAEALGARGIAVGEAVLYDQVALPLTVEAQTAVRSGSLVLAPLFSARTARLFDKALAGWLPPRVMALCISPAVAEALEEAGLPLRVSLRPDARGIADLLAEVLATGPVP